ncbi:MAG: rod shape-determining protein MreD [Clostridia bacterium]|nr:rod shape-determining protein MreD [Clostridia bacterium]
MKYRYAIIAFVLAFIIQGTLLNTIGIFHTTPNLILCLALSLAFLYEDEYGGVILGVIFGLFTDICYAQYVGIASLGYLLLCIGATLIKEILNKENIASILIVTAVGTFLYNVYYWAVMHLFGSSYGILFVLKQQPVAIAYNLAVVFIIYRVLIKRVVKYHYDRYYK